MSNIDTLDPTIKSQLNLLMSGVKVKRFHTVPTINQETVGHHSSIVAGLLYILWPEKLYLLPHAIFHDLPEHITGDTPSPGKRLFVDRDRMKSAESQIFANASVQLPELNSEDARCLKICDILAGMATCQHEMMMGNSYVKESMRNYHSYILEIGPHHPNVLEIVKYFMNPEVCG
jgi:5'-deoxynucleotidase YfbR-like HD superfamily hydrolase